MPGQIEPITTDFWPSIAATLGTHFNGMPIAGNKKLSKYLTINYKYVEIATDDWASVWVFGFGFWAWLLALGSFLFVARLCNLLAASWSCWLVAIASWCCCCQPVANTSSMILLHPKKPQALRSLWTWVNNINTKGKSMQMLPDRI